MKLFTSIILAAIVSAVSFPFSADAASIRGGDAKPAMVESSASENVVNGSPAGVVEPKENGRQLRSIIENYSFERSTATVTSSSTISLVDYRFAEAAARYELTLTNYMDDEGIQRACGVTAQITAKDEFETEQNHLFIYHSSYSNPNTAYGSLAVITGGFSFFF